MGYTSAFYLSFLLQIYYYKEHVKRELVRGQPHTFILDYMSCILIQNYSNVFPLMRLEFFSFLLLPSYYTGHARFSMMTVIINYFIISLLPSSLHIFFFYNPALLCITSVDGLLMTQEYFHYHNYHFFIHRFPHVHNFHQMHFQSEKQFHLCQYVKMNISITSNIFINTTF